MIQTKTYCGTSPDFTDILSLQEYFKMAEIYTAYGDKTPGCINAFESCSPTGLNRVYSGPEGHQRRILI